MPADTVRPRPGPPPGRTAAPRPTTRINGVDVPRTEPRQQISADQYIRLQAIRIAADYHHTRAITSPAAILTTAREYAEFIRSGQTNTEGI